MVFTWFYCHFFAFAIRQWAAWASTVITRKNSLKDETQGETNTKNKPMHRQVETNQPASYSHTRYNSIRTSRNLPMVSIIGAKEHPDSQESLNTEPSYPVVNHGIVKQTNKYHYSTAWYFQPFTHMYVGVFFIRCKSRWENAPPKFTPLKRCPRLSLWPPMGSETLLTMPHVCISLVAWRCFTTFTASGRGGAASMKTSKPSPTTYIGGKQTPHPTNALLPVSVLLVQVS